MNMRDTGLPAPEAGAFRLRQVIDQSDRGRRARRDPVAEEVPVALEYNGTAHAVMMASPCDLEDFALGFSLTEGILQRPDELYDCEIDTVEGQGIVLRLEIASERFAGLRARRRTLAGRTGCGLCGIDSLQAMAEEPPAVPVGGGEDIRVRTVAVERALAALTAAQRLFHHTGTVHAVAWADMDGKLQWVREDVGRHNAFDKLLGAMARARADAATGFAICTSRASYEMVLKAARGGVRVLLAVSGPTGRAIDLADRCGLTLAGFVRGRRAVIYTHPQRVSGLFEVVEMAEAVNG